MDPTQSGSTQGSPFIRGDISLVPPSPELNPSSHYGSVLDFPTNVLGSPNLGDNSGSFHGSPYSHHSDLSFVTAEGDLSFELFSDHEGVSGFDNLGSAGLHQPGSDFDYDPLDFDAPGSANSLMIYDTDYMSPPPFGSPSPDQQGGRSGSVPFDYPSPGSTNDDGNDRRSRASSVSSAHRAQQSGQYYHSPRLDVAQSFENMTVRSPSWGVQGLPQTQAPQQHKAPSPPRLVMPDGHDQPPTINAPDDLDGGPQLHIVPATPIGVPGASGMGAHFQDPLNTLNHGSEIASNQPSWAQPTTIKSSESRQASPFRYPANLPDDTSNNRHSDFLGSVNANSTTPFLFPQQQRHRSKSDNALDPPTWDNNFVQQQLQQQQGDNSALGLDLESAGNVDDNGMNTASSTSSTNANNSAAYTMQTFQFGGGGFLSPNSHDFNGMRRAKSENGQRMGHRQSRSEDIRGLQHTGMQLPPQQQQQQQQFTLPHSNPNSNFGHGHSLSLSASRGQNLLFPPSNEFGMPQNPNLLSTNTLPIPSRASSPGHIRRASSGTRSGRGIGAESWSAEYGGTTVSSARVSPYPSPNASPRVGGRELDLDLGREDQYTIPDGVPSAGFENEVALSGRMALNAQAAASVHQGTIPGMGTMPMGVGEVPPVAVVSKPNVTTLRTANASHKRRKQEASFVCPFPGCGSTFTRSFNLKGHIRSHNEEKPFVCHWPGCGKGFARQHDCKRHEQLHTNYRPFTCEGCNRNFARMDALNRHLRSEGGTECAKLQPQGGSNASSSPGSAAQSPPPADKPGQQGHQRTTSRQEGSPNLNPKETGGLIFQPNTGWNPMSGAGTAVGVSL